jgi:hypothetical protein
MAKVEEAVQRYSGPIWRISEAWRVVEANGVTVLHTLLDKRHMG